MKVEVRCFSREIALDGPDTPEQFDQLAGSVGACLREATLNVVYRGTLTAVRAEVCEKIEERTDLERKTRPSGRKDESGEDIVEWDESELEFVKRADAAGHEALVTEIINEVVAGDSGKIDPAKKERKSAGPKKVAKMYLTLAQKIIDAGKAEIRATELSSRLGITVDPADPLSIARAISENERRKRAELTDEYIG